MNRQKSLSGLWHLFGLPIMLTKYLGKEFHITPYCVSLPGVSPEWKGPELYAYEIPFATHTKSKSDIKVSDINAAHFIYNCENSLKRDPILATCRNLGTNSFLLEQNFSN